MSDLATRLRTACDQVRVKSYPLSDLIPLMQQAADAIAAAPVQPAPSAAPGGFAVVPMDATDNMMAAFAKTAAAEIDWHGATEIERQEVRDGFGPAYRAMLSAAPQPSPTPQADSQPTTGEPMGTEAQEATAWRLRAENLERENEALRELIAEAPSYFAPQYDFEGRKLAWIKSADAAISAQGDSHD